ncbi:MAG TPA: winged helix-turn-helix domain-containing protein [Candidatus Obscuribacterales bacterium]|jgi:transposase
MVRKAHLHPHLTSCELKSRYLCASDRVESRRWHLLWLVSKNWTIQQAAQAVGLNYDYAKDIVKGYNQQAEKAIANRRHQRREPPSHALLNAEQLEQLRSSLKQPPPDKGLWTGPKVADWIAKKTGREKVWPQRGWDYLKKCRYSSQRPRPHHTKADPVAQQEFKKNCIKQLENCNESFPMQL